MRLISTEKNMCQAKIIICLALIALFFEPAVGLDKKVVAKAVFVTIAHDIIQHGSRHLRL